MAKELTISMAVQFSKAPAPVLNINAGSFTVDVAGSNPILNVQNIGTTKEALVLGDVGTLGYCILQNLDGTNFVDVYPNATDAALTRLLFGEFCCFRIIPGATPNAKADTAAVNLRVCIFPN